MTVAYDRETLMKFAPPELPVVLVDLSNAGGGGGGSCADSDSWSTVRRDKGGGKRRYPPEYMLSLANNPDCKGPAPPHVPLELRKLIRGFVGGGGGGGPGRHQSGGGGRHGGGGGGRGLLPPPSRGGPGGNVRTIVLPSKAAAVKLHTAGGNAWNPKKESDAPDAKMVKVARGILNKITAETFDSLSKQLLDCGIDSEWRVKAVLDLIFSKALDQAFFNHLYAQICFRMSSLNVENVLFKKLLLEKCQDQFTKVTNTSDEAKAAELELEATLEPEDLELHRNKRKRHLMGYMKFIGELWLVEVMKPRVVGTCIVKLLELCELDEEYAECCCNLLKTIGPGMDSLKNTTPAQKESVNRWFQVLETKKGLANISIRMCMTIENLIDLRLNRWKKHS